MLEYWRVRGIHEVYLLKVTIDGALIVYLYQYIYKQVHCSLWHFEVLHWLV